MQTNILLSFGPNQNTLWLAQKMKGWPKYSGFLPETVWLCNLKSLDGFSCWSGTRAISVAKALLFVWSFIPHLIYYHYNFS